MPVDSGNGQPTSELRREDIVRAIQGSFEPVRVRLAYRLALLIVAGAMVLLPALYLAFAGAVAWATYLHATRNTWLIRTPGGCFSAVVVYAGPIVAGTLGFLFLFKPILARQRPRNAPLPLSAGAETALYAFVDRLARTVRAPSPSRIEVDCQVNASASLGRGLSSFLGTDLVLTIGLPLAAGLSLPQFAGVLAHELGHFAQGTGMRFSALVRSISRWFARVVYQRDAWDHGLEDAIRSSPHVLLTLVLWMALGFAWLSRAILWLLMATGNALSSFLRRQMELDADRYEARVAGSDTFEETTRALRLLGLASQMVRAGLDQGGSCRKLPDDLPHLIASVAADTPPGVVEAFEKWIAGRRTGLFDTHPTEDVRIASAREERACGIVRLDVPASALFRDFQATCREVTLAFYRATIGQDEV